jgi:hypothetical protein
MSPLSPNMDPTKEKLSELKALLNGFTYLEPKMQSRFFGDLIEVAMDLSTRMRAMEKRFEENEG